MYFIGFYAPNINVNKQLRLQSSNSHLSLRRLHRSHLIILQIRNISSRIYLFQDVAKGWKVVTAHLLRYVSAKGLYLSGLNFEQVLGYRYTQNLSDLDLVRII